MLSRFRWKIRVRRNRHEYSFQDGTNWFWTKHADWTWLSNCRFIFWNFGNFWKLENMSSKNFVFNNFWENFEFSKNQNMCVRTLADEYVCKFSSRYLEKRLHFDVLDAPKGHFFYLRGFCHFPDFQILSGLGHSKSVLGFFAFLTKIWPKNMYCTAQTQNFKIWPFLNLDLW